MTLRELRAIAARFGATVRHDGFGGCYEVEAPRGSWFENEAHALIEWYFTDEPGGAAAARARLAERLEEPSLRVDPCPHAVCEWCADEPGAEP